jgi:hypothetical protein
MLLQCASGHFENAAFPPLLETNFSWGGVSSNEDPSGRHPSPRGGGISADLPPYTGHGEGAIWSLNVEKYNLNLYTFESAMFGNILIVLVL